MKDGEQMQNEPDEREKTCSKPCVLFMSKVDARFCVDPTIIRSNLFMYSLFADELCIADSLLNNHPKLRKLIWPQESNQLKEVNCDIGIMLEKGFLKPLVRKGLKSFSHLWKMQSSAHTPNLPPPEYPEYLDSINIERYEYDLFEVSKRFTYKAKRALHNAKETLSECSLEVNKPKCKKAIDSLLARIEDSETNVEHKELYNTLKTLQDKGALSTFEFDWINNCLNDAYAHNVPATLKMPICADYRNLPMRVTDYCNCHRNSELVSIDSIPVKFPWVFSKFALNMLNIENLVEIRKCNEYKLVRDAFNGTIFDKGDLEAFAGNIEKYGEKISCDLKNVLSNDQKKKMSEQTMPDQLEIKRVFTPEECFVSITPIGADLENEQIFIRRTYNYMDYIKIHNEIVAKQGNLNTGVIFRDEAMLDG